MVFLKFYITFTLEVLLISQIMKKEIKFSLVYRDMFQSSGKFQPLAEQLEKIAPVIVEMGCFARVETNGGAFEQVNLILWQARTPTRLFAPSLNIFTKPAYRHTCSTER